MGNWNPDADNGLSQDIALIQQGRFNVMTTIGLDGNAWITHYTNPVDGQSRVDWTDAGGVVTGYGYFGDATTPGFKGTVGYDQGNHFGQYVRSLVNAEGWPQNVREFDLWDLSNRISYMGTHMFGDQKDYLKSAPCQGLQALSASAMFMTGPWAEYPEALAWGTKGFAFFGFGVNATVCK
jgi:hypothetical protein